MTRAVMATAVMTKIQRLRAATRLAIFASALLGLTGCERDNPTPPDGGGRRDAGPGDAGEVTSDAGPGDAGTDADASKEDCVTEEGCWSCPPTQPQHFLNGCTDATCSPFPVTTTRLPRLRADGTVPPLP